MDTPHTAGTQSLRRSLALLRLLARHQVDGLGLQEAIAQSGFERSTTHRLLSCLVEEGFAERNPDTRRYHLGVDAMQTGLAALHRDPLLEALKPFGQRLARLSGDTVFMLVRQGDYALCLLRETGEFPIKIFTTRVGERRLLGVGVGGLTLLAGLPDTEVHAVLTRQEVTYRQAGLTPSALWNAVRSARAQGYAEDTDTVTPGVSGIAMAFPVSELTTVAFSLGGITSRLTPARRQDLAQLLKAEWATWSAERASGRRPTLA